MFKLYLRRPWMAPGPPHYLATYSTKEEAEEQMARLKEDHPHCRFLIKEQISEGAAKEFWRDLMGTLRFTTKGTHGIMGTALIADHMSISIEKAYQFLNACVEYGITERQGGGWVV